MNSPLVRYGLTVVGVSMVGILWSNSYMREHSLSGVVGLFGGPDAGYGRAQDIFVVSILAFVVGIVVLGAGFFQNLRGAPAPESTPQSTQPTTVSAAPRHTLAETSAISPSSELEKHGVTFDGKQYIYQQFRYDRLEDALAYAKLVEQRRGV